MATTDFLQQPVSDSMLLQILMYQHLSPTWGYMPGEPSACCISQEKNKELLGSRQLSSWIWQKNNITENTCQCLDQAQHAFRSIPSSRQLSSTYSWFANIKSFFQKKCLSGEKTVVLFSKLFHPLMVADFLMLWTVLCSTSNFRLVQALRYKMHVLCLRLFCTAPALFNSADTSPRPQQHPLSVCISHSLLPLQVPKGLLQEHWNEDRKSVV